MEIFGAPPRKIGPNLLKQRTSDQPGDFGPRLQSETRRCSGTDPQPRWAAPRQRGEINATPADEAKLILEDARSVYPEAVLFIEDAMSVAPKFRVAVFSRAISPLSAETPDSAARSI